MSFIDLGSTRLDWFLKNIAASTACLPLVN